MKTSSNPSARFSAFTLVELLVVIAIIAILAAMVLPVLGKVKEQGKVNIAKVEMSGLITAIQICYHSAYGRYPCSTNAMIAATAKQEDFTYYDGTTGPAAMNNVAPMNVAYDAPNSEVMAILMDVSDGNIGTLNNPNWNHQKNPRNISANFKKSGYDPATTTGDPYPGVDNNYVYRDPWGHPYVISMDLNYDEKCMDAVYRYQGVSQVTAANGYYGLINTPPPSNPGSFDYFAYNGGVMVWSKGTDKDMNKTAKANQSPNKDNVLSWKP